MISSFDLNLRHLDAVVAAWRTGSITAASNLVNLSQPSLTQAIGHLERQLGHSLFDRHPGGVVATPAGELFARRIERAVECIAESCRALQRRAKVRPLPYPERHITMTQIRAFLAVADEGSHARAARALGLAQPSVHRAAKELELNIGVALFARSGALVRLTPAGERAARGLRLALAELRAGLDDLAALRGRGAGRIVVGSLPHPRARILPSALASFAAHHPEAKIVIVDGPYTELVSALRDGQIDFLVGALREDPRADVAEEALFADDLHIVAAARHPLAGSDPGPGDLTAYPWVVAAPGAPMRLKWEAIFAGAPVPDRTIQCGSILAARGLLLAGDWLALMSRDQFRVEQDAGLLAPIGPAVPNSSRLIGLTTRPDWRPTRAQAALVDEIRAAARNRY